MAGENTDIGRFDMEVPVEISDIPMHFLPDPVGQAPQPGKLTFFKQSQSFFPGDPFTGQYLFPDAVQDWV